MKKFLTALVLTAGLSVATLAADKPNFSGDWKMNVDKCVFPEFGNMAERMRSGNMTRSIKHEDPKIGMSTKMSGNGQEMVTEVVYSSDGKTMTNKGGMGGGGMGGGRMGGGGSAKTKGSWDGAVLVLKTEREINMQGQEMTITSEERWALTDGGKTLVVDTTNNTPMGPMTSKFVFDKQ
jgi:hypothetical protein